MYRKVDQKTVLDKRLFSRDDIALISFRPSYNVVMFDSFVAELEEHIPSRGLEAKMNIISTLKRLFSQANMFRAHDSITTHLADQKIVGI